MKVELFFVLYFPGKNYYYVNCFTFYEPNSFFQSEKAFLSQLADLMNLNFRVKQEVIVSFSQNQFHIPTFALVHSSILLIVAVIMVLSIFDDFSSHPHINNRISDSICMLCDYILTSYPLNAHIYCIFCIYTFSLQLKIHFIHNFLRVKASSMIYKMMNCICYIWLLIILCL